MFQENHPEKIYDKKLLVLERNHDRNPKASSFVINLSGVAATDTYPGSSYEHSGFGDLKDVVGIKLYSFDIVPKNAVDSTITKMKSSSVYILLNNYDNMITGSSKVPVAFGRAFVYGNTGVSYVGSSPPNMGSDPFTYIFDPVLGRLSQFNVSLVDSDGNPFDVKDNNVIITLAVFTKRNKYMRM